MKNNNEFGHLQFFAETEEYRPTRRASRKSSRLPGWLNGKTIALVVGCLALVVVLAIVISSFSAGGKFDMIDRELLPANFGDRDSLHFFVGGKKLDTKLDAEAFNDWKSSMNGQVAWFTVDEEEDEVLYVLDGENILWVAENPQQITMAETGAALVYIADEELCLYTVNKKSGEKIATDITDILAISPDGKTVAYTDAEGVCYIYSEGKTVSLDEDVTVLSVADGGKFIYCIGQDEENNTCLYLYTIKGQQGLVASGVNTDEDAVFYTNKDHSQLIFQAEGKSGYRWYAVEQNELEDSRHNLNSADIFEPLIPEGAQSYNSGSLTVLGVENMTDMVYCSHDEDDTSMKLIYVSSNWETSTLVSKVTEAQIGEDGKTIYYAKGSRLFSIEAKAGAQSKQLAEKVESYAVTPDGEGVYYLNEDGVAFYQKGNKVEQIGENVEELTVTYEGYALFVSNGSLYCSEQGDKVKTVVEDFVDGYVEAAADGTYYRISDGEYYVVYGASSGIKFEKLGEEDLWEEPEEPDNADKDNSADKDDNADNNTDKTDKTDKNDKNNNTGA